MTSIVAPCMRGQKRVEKRLSRNWVLCSSVKALEIVPTTRRVHNSQARVSDCKTEWSVLGLVRRCPAHFLSSGVVLTRKSPTSCIYRSRSSQCDICAPSRVTQRTLGISLNHGYRLRLVTSSVFPLTMSVSTAIVSACFQPSQDLREPVMMNSAGP